MAPWVERIVTATVRVWEDDPPPPDRHPLLVGASGKLWNHVLSGSYPIGSKRDKWEGWLGHPIDGSESFPGRSTADQMAWIDPDFGRLPGYRVVTLPAQPQGPNRDQGNQLGASGEFNWWWREYGRKLTALGMNTPFTVVRLNHEPQPVAYAWHPWNWANPGVDAFVAAFINAAYNLKLTAPNVRVSVNHSRGHFDTSLTGGRTWGECTDLLMEARAADGRFLVDFVTQDSYDNSPGVTPLGIDPGANMRLVNWRLQTNGVNSDTPPKRDKGFGIPCRGTAYAFCEDWSERRGEPVWFWHHEWGLSHRPDSNGGGDDPHYIDLMHDWFTRRAVGNGGLMLGESYFNHRGAPDTNRHQVFDPDTGVIPAHNARAGARFRELWGV